jgi:SAM-dependent methyltransferase
VFALDRDIDGAPRLLTDIYMKATTLDVMPARDARIVERTSAPARSIAERLRLALRVLRVHYMMPATGVWRLFETEVVLDRMRGSGRGLDVGCGDGRLAEVYLSGTPGVRWTGLEIDAHDAALARQRGVYQQVLHCSATEIPEPDASFDLVFANSVLEHMPPLDEVLAEVARVLKPGGRMAFTVPAPELRSLLPRARMLRRLGLHAAADRYVADVDRRIAHVNYLSPDEWERRLARVGLQVTTEVRYLSQRTVTWWSRLAEMTGGLAWAITRGKLTPRQVQQRTGMVDGDRPILGLIAWLALSPILTWTSSERNPRKFGALYVEAVRSA